jgi:hypothetical protein
MLAYFTNVLVLQKIKIAQSVRGRIIILLTMALDSRS